MKKKYMLLLILSFIFLIGCKTETISIVLVSNEDTIIIEAKENQDLKNILKDTEYEEYIDDVYYNKEFTNKYEKNLLNHDTVFYIRTKQICLTFKGTDIEKKIMVDKGSEINDEILKTLNIENLEGLYYDEQFLSNYSNEQLLENTIIYVKQKEEIDKFEVLELDNDLAPIVNMYSGSSLKMPKLLQYSIYSIENGHKTLYHISISKDDYYVIGGYVSDENYVVPRFRHHSMNYYKNVSWLKFDSFNDVLDTYNDLPLNELYIVFNVDFISDVINDIECNWSTKYYSDLINISANVRNINNDDLEKYIEGLSEDMFVCLDEDIKEFSDFCLFDHHYNYGYQCLLDEKSEKFIIIEDKVLYDDYEYNLLENELGKYYEELYDLAIPDETLTEEYKYEDKIQLIKKVKINIANIKRIIGE